MDLRNHLTEAMIRQHASGESFRRGDDYRRNDAVSPPVVRGDTLTAEVEGSDYEPYRVTVTLGENGIDGATCTCPYDWGGWCKHIVAVLLLCLHAPEMVEERPALEELLAGMDRDVLNHLLLRLIERHPELADEVAWLTAGSGASPQAAGRQAAPIDAGALGRQVRAAFRRLGRGRDYDGYYHDDEMSEALEAVGEAISAAETLVEAGEGRTALTALEAVTEAYAEAWSEYRDYDDEGELTGVFDDLGPAWAEALLIAGDLAPEERRGYARKLRAWQSEIDDYGGDPGLEPGIEAAEEGWDDPTLVRVLRGDLVRDASEEAEEEAEEDVRYGRYVDFMADRDQLTGTVAEARLNVLERQERWEEFLRLAAWEGRHARAAATMAALGRYAEAEAYALRHLRTASDALDVARALEQKGESERGLRVAERGLDLRGSRHALALHLRDRAAAAGRQDMAIRAGAVAVRAQPELLGWRRLAELAGEDWPTLRAGLLAEFRERPPYSPHGLAEILIEEGQMEDALALARQNPHDSPLIGRVVDAAVATHPNDVIPLCRGQADPIMDGGQSGAYEEAARWLEKAKTAYRAASREGEWHAYHADLIERHRRKYKLMPLLKKLAG